MRNLRRTLGVFPTIKTVVDFDGNYWERKLVKYLSVILVMYISRVSSIYPGCQLPRVPKVNSTADDRVNDIHNRCIAIRSYVV